MEKNEILKALFNELRKMEEEIFLAPSATHEAFMLQVGIYRGIKASIEIAQGKGRQDDDNL